MIFASYADFRNRVHSLLDGDDISQSDLSVDVLDTIIGNGEIRVYRDVRSSCQEAALAITATANAAPLPADFLELKGAPYTAKCRVSTFVPWETIQGRIQTGIVIGSNQIYYSFEGDTMIFYPAQDGTTINGRYYRRFADIATGLNTLFTRHPDLFIYAALCESAPLLGEMTRQSIWESKYTGLALSANEQERRRITRGSKLAIKVG